MTMLVQPSAGWRAGIPQYLEADYPALEIPSTLRRSVATALQQGETHYTAVAGVEPVRTELLAALVERGITTKRNDLLLTAGEQESRFLAIQTLRRAGARLAVPMVVHPGVRQAAAILTSTPVVMDVDPERLTVTPAGVQAALLSGATAIYIENPARLSGACISPTELAEIGRLCAEARAWIIWDAGLSDWLPADTSRPTIDLLGTQTLVFGMPWPTLGLEPWSPGYLVGPPEMMDQCRSIKQVISICTNTLTQWSGSGGAAVYTSEHAARIIAQQQRHREVLDAAISAGLTPIIGDSLATLALRLTPEQRIRFDTLGIAVADGTLFGTAGVIRVAIAGDGSTAQVLRTFANQEVSA